MYSETTDDTAQQTPDLNRVLAEAMSDRYPDVAPQTDGDDSAVPDSSVVLHWSSPIPGVRSSKRTVLGIEYSPEQLTIVEIRQGRRPSLLGLQTVRFDNPPGSAVLADLLRAFNPASHNCVQVTLTSARAVVRQFRLPPVSKRRRRAAAIWEAQKLIPFPLKDSEAVFGFTFAPSARKGWQVTLAAVPRDDACPILTAIRDIEWTIGGVSIAGTQWLSPGNRMIDAEPAKSMAAVLWSPERTSFVMFSDSELKFHYDLGPVLLPPLPAGQEPSQAALQTWLKALGKGIGEAFEFYSGAHGTLAIDRIELYGVPESAAPLITDWQERFGAPAVIVNPLRVFTIDLPEDTGEWLASQSATLTTAVIAAAGTPTVDMTPAAMVRTRSRQKSERIARLVLVASVLAAAIWIGFLWVQQTLTARSTARSLAQLEELKTSLVNGQLRQASLELEQVSTLAQASTVPGIRWTPYLKTILATFPPDVRLMALSSEPPVGMMPGTCAIPTLRLDGKISPTTRSHALIYADWFGRIEQIAGHGSVKLISNRAIDWKGQRTSVFSIEVTPQLQPKERMP